MLFNIKKYKNILFFSFFGLFLQSCTTTSKYLVINTDNQGRKIYNLPYGLESRQKMDVFLPQNKSHFPLVVLVHGGAWKYGDKSHMRQIQQWLFQQDIPSVAINYSLVSKKITYHKQLEDIDLSLQKIFFEKENWNLSSEQLILLGESAGAHLALVYGYTHPDRISKIISLSAPTDFFSPQFLKSTYSKYALPTIEKMVGTKMNRQNPSEYFQKASPIALVSSVPTLIFQGGNDILVSSQQGYALDSVLAEKKIPHRLVFMKNAGHVPRLTNKELRDKIIYPNILEWITKDTAE